VTLNEMLPPFAAITRDLSESQPIQFQFHVRRQGTAKDYQRYTIKIQAR
jgi:hypothetical protein